MRRVLAVLAVALAAAPSAVAAQSEGIRLSEIAGTRFPERAYAVNVPPALGTRDVRLRVTENGERVSRLTVVPSAASVLAIDASNSMRGEPIEAAMTAARAFAARRKPHQHLAVVLFNGNVRVALPFTSDQARIDRVLAQSPRLAEGTHIYDAVQAAADLLRRSQIPSGTLVVLSDGADVGSVATREAAVATARDARARVFSVGLASRTFDREALSTLANETNGSYAEASSTAELEGIFDRLGAELANEYLIRYRSLAGPEENVRVVVTVEDLAERVRAEYVTPALPTDAAAPYEPSSWLRFWRSTAAFALVALIAMGLFAFGILTALRPSSNEGVRRRIGEFVSITPASRGAGGERLDALGRVPAIVSRWERFKEELEIARIRVPAEQILLWTVVGTVALGTLLWIVAGPVAAFLALATPVLAHVVIQNKLERQRRAFVDQLPDNLAVLGAALRAGHSLLGALSVVVEDAGEPARTEFRRVIAQEQMGVPLEDAFEEVARRMECRDLEQVALVAALGRDTGGNTAEVLDRVTETIRERSDLRRLVRTLTAQGRMSRWIVSFLPVLLLIAITFINPDYMQPLYDKTFGRVLLVAAAVLVVAGSLVIRRIVNIKV